MTSSNKKIWLITGTSSGFGRELVEQVTATGDFVVGTLRNDAQIEAYNTEFKGKAKFVRMDVTKSDQVQAGVEQVVAEYGRIDVLVNNAGFGMMGAVEELSMAEIRTQMETNLFGLIDVTQRVLPVMRQQGSGTVVMLSSVAGLQAGAGFGIYNTSKFAVEGLSEALHHEITPLGLRVLLVEPGPYRTKFAAGSSMKRAMRKIDAYAETAHQSINWLETIDGKQDGDPVKAVQLIIKQVNNPAAPLRLVLGARAIERARGKMEWLEADIKATEAESLATDYPESERAA